MSKKETFWIPYADLMTVLMVIFLFISLSYMGLVQFQKNQQDEIFKEYKQTKKALYSELDSTFKDNFKQWNVAIDSNDLSIKFNNPQVLFEPGSDVVNKDFRQILSEFFPKYLNIVLQEKYKDKISEIRIEGHTDTKPTGETNDPYVDNIILSQKRSMQVLRFVRQLSTFTSLEEKKKSQLQFWLTANGLSYGRTLDDNNNLTFYSKQKANEDFSRRVEFRIVTTSDKLVEKVLEQLNK
jgi:outer membrane protein OmpA-like peptidoglycan-associated protein